VRAICGRAAIAVVADHGGALPADEQALRALPGVGPYTAAAVASIAFDRRAFALDGNGLRVLARLGAVRAPVNRPATRVALHAMGLALVPAARAGDFNQAMMELGALVCTPRAPACGDCPVRAHCAAQAAGMNLDELPVKDARPARQPVHIACAVVERSGRVLLCGASPASCWRGPGPCPRRWSPPARRRQARSVRGVRSRPASWARAPSRAAACATSSPS